MGILTSSNLGSLFYQRKEETNHGAFLFDCWTCVQCIKEIGSNSIEKEIGSNSIEEFPNN